MADDIDIEEHDVLESLRRRQLTDTPIIKSEPLEVEYEESNYEDGNYDYQWESEKDKVEIKVEPHTEEFRFGKIILGSKPAKPQENNEETPSGSQDGQGISEENYNYNMSLVLDDWGPILERSDCYCKTCETLFATVNALDAHKMIAHSFLVATEKQPSPERNKAIKSTAKPSYTSSNDLAICQICHSQFKGSSGKSNLLRHYRNVHKVDPNTVKSDSDFKTWRVCNHCNLYFPDDTSLVKHLYALLPLNDKTPTKDDKRTSGQAVKPKPVLNVDKNVTQTVKATNSRTSNVKQVNSPFKKDITSGATALPNKIILGSKPMAVKTENINQTEDLNKRKCEICSIEYEKKYYLTHMKKFHSDFSEKQPNKIILGDTKVRYKCLMCSEILTTLYALKKHRDKHQNMKGKHLYVKLVNKINKTKAKPNLINREPVKIKPNVTKQPVKMYSSKDNLKNEVEEANTNVLVSKSILFKCNRCSVHFLTCTGACQHSIVCESSSNIRDWACPQCQRVFKSAEKAAHEYQHKMLKANTFKVYVVYLEMIVRILCQCPNCFVCFEEDKFWRHVNGGCDDAASYFCNECRLPIDIHAKTNHDSKHKKGDFTKEDFIKIDYISSKPPFVPKKIKTEVVEDVKHPVKAKVELETPKRGLKRKLEMPVVSQKKRKITDELLLFYCQSCKSYLGGKSSVHMSGSCREKQKGPRAFCKYCGIQLKHKYHSTHMSLHIKIPNLTIADFTFVKLMANSKKLKPVQELYPCKSCQVNFLTKMARHLHKCKETISTSCHICEKNIQSDLFNTHIRIHNYTIPRQVKTISEMMQTPRTSVDDTKSPMTQKFTKSPMAQILTRKETKSPMTNLPDLLMKYESLTALWNIIYLCAICDTFTDSYDKVVEHCQNHLTNMENYGVVIMKCEKCDMKFDSECYKRHLELHAGNKVISKKTFQILKYEHYNLFSDTWFDFIDLPDEQKSQIVRRSIYGQNRCVKMKLIQQGPPEYTLYKCEKCLKCLGADNILYHVKLANCLKANKNQCSICNLTFAIRRDCEKHEAIHESTGLGLQSFRIVSFNDANDVEANQTIMSYDAQNHGSKSKISFIDDEVAPKLPKLSKNSAPVKSFVFYKCADCLTCVAHMRNFSTHACNDKNKKQCNDCGIYYNATHGYRHRLLHQKYSFTRKNVIVKTMNKAGKVINIKKQSPEKKSVVGNTQNKINENADQKSKLYKCFCGLHYTSLKSIEKHYKMKNCSTVIREKCSQCNLIFDPIEVVNHLCKHHAQNQVQTFNVITPNKKTLYKCGLCHVLFYNKAVAIPHKAKCSGNFSGKKCEKCGLAFDVSSLATHMVDHERNNKLRNDCYVIVKIPDDKVAVVDKGIHQNTLYKCKLCDIHFLRRTSARNHITKRTNCGTTLAETCKICKRRFPVKSISRHAWQHNKLKIKEFYVRELIFGVNTKLPKDNQKGEMVKNKVKKEVEAVNVRVYRCTKCMLLFTDEITLSTHHQDRCSKELTDECEECNVKFASKNIKDHNKLHGPGVSLSMTIIEDVQIPDDIEMERKVNRVSLPHEPKDLLDRYDNKLYKCTICNVHYLTPRSLERHRHNDRKGSNNCNPDVGVQCDLCDITFTSYSLNRHKLIHEKYNFKKEDFVIMTLTDEVKLPKTPENIEIERKLKTTRNPRGIEMERKVNRVSYEPKDPLDRYDNKLYKCTVCNLHYLTQATLLKHDKDCNPNRGVNCDICDIAFTSYSLKRHMSIHEKYNFKKDDFVIVTLAKDIHVAQTPEDVRTEKILKEIPRVQNNHLLDTYDNKLYKCTVCELHYLKQSTLEKHTDCNPNAGVICEVCDIAFTSYSLKRHKSIHDKYNYKKEDFVILTLADVEPRSSQDAVKVQQEIEGDSILEDTSLDSSLELESTEKSPDKSKIEEPNKHSTSIIHFLYKCAECNVYYTTRVSCLKHVAKHTPLDPKEYIGCKLCAFQFTIMGLPAHIKKHHANPLNLKEVLVEEYKPNNIKTHETYYASEKDQSTLVSTSEDVKNDSVLREENYCEVSSCNEITENIDYSDNSSIQNNVDFTGDKNKVIGPSNDLKERTEPGLGNGNAVVDSSDNNDITMEIDVDNNKTKGQTSNDLKEFTEAKSSENGVVIDSTDNNSTRVSEDIVDNKTNANEQASNESKETDAPNTSENIVDCSDNNSTQGMSDVNDKIEVTGQVTNNLKEITEPGSGEGNVTVASDIVKTDDNKTEINDDSKEITEPIS